MKVMSLIISSNLALLDIKELLELFDSILKMNSIWYLEEKSIRT